MSQPEDTTALTLIQESLRCMEKKLSDVTANVDTLKQLPSQRTAQPPGVGNSGVVHSTQLAQSVLSPGETGKNMPFLQTFRGLKESSLRKKTLQKSSPRAAKSHSLR